MKEAPKKRNQTGLFLPNREVSWVVAAVLFLSFMFFTLGYFWGQKRAVSSFLGKVEEETFADKITYSLYTMNGKFSDEESGESEEPLDSNNASEELLEEPLIITTSLQPVIVEQETKESFVEKKDLDKVYVAPLIGFGTLPAAQSFEKRVEKYGISVIIKERKSTTAKGKKMSWYQAVSQEYDTKEALENVIAVLQKKEKIKDIRILEKKKG